MAGAERPRRWGIHAPWAGLAAVVSLAGPAGGQTISWDGDLNNSWQSPLNWAGNALPVNGFTAFIGVAPNNDVLLNADAVGVFGVDDLIVADGASLSTNGFRIQVDEPFQSGNTLVRDGATLLMPAVAGNPNAFAIDTDRMQLRTNSTFIPLGRALIAARLDLDSGATLSGTGTLQIGDGTASATVGLNNDGVVAPGFLGGGTLTLVSDNLRTFDLDGSSLASEDGVVRVTADGLFGVAATELVVDAQLQDAFSTRMDIGRRDAVEFVRPWELDGRLVFDGADGGDAASLRGAELTALPGASIEVADGTAAVNADVTMNGGTFSFADSTRADLNGVVRVNPAANFNLGSDNLDVFVNGTTEIRQTAPIDLDGFGISGFNTITVAPSASLRIDPDFADPFDGTLAVDTNGTLTLNGTGIVTSVGQLDLNADNIRLNIGGDLTLNAPVDLDGNGPVTNTIVITNPGAVLRVRNLIDTDPDGDFDGSLEVRGTLDVDVPGFFWVNDSPGTLLLTDVGADPTVAGDTLNNEGLITGNGRFTAAVQNNAGGRVRPGSASTAGRLYWENNGLTVNGGSEVEFDLGGPAPTTQHDRIDTLALSINGGDLDLDLIGGYLPGLYVEHVLIDSVLAITGAQGVFDTVTGVVVPATGTGLAVTYAASEVLVQRAVLGDANLNGQVEQGDLDAVLQNWGRSNFIFGQAVSWATGDLTGDGRVDQADLDFVLQNWGDTGVPDFGGAVVPEPASASVALAGLGLCRRGRRFRAARAASASHGSWRGGSLATPG